MLIFMSLGALILIKYFKKHNLNATGSSAVKIEILSSLRLTSRDMFFVVHCGPDVVAFVLTQSGACLLGRWPYEQWNETASRNEEVESRK